jgi:hypothetical protein
VPLAGEGIISPVIGIALRITLAHTRCNEVKLCIAAANILRNTISTATLLALSVRR